MSRLIPTRPDRSEAAPLRNTASGKLILTAYNACMLALLIRGNRLLHVSVLTTQSSSIGAVYLGKVKRVQKNLEACFVEIAEGELVYLPLSECRQAFLINRTPDGRILEGDELPVQIVRDALKTKQAAATAKIALTGRFVVVSTGSQRVGISGKLSPEQRNRFHSLLKAQGFMDDQQNLIPSAAENAFSAGQYPSYGIVIRTEAAGVSDEEVLGELKTLSEAFLSIYRHALHRTCFSCLSPAKAPWEAAMEQIPVWEYEEAITDDSELKEQMKGYFASRHIPFRLYHDASYPLSKLYSLESRLEEALSRRVWLKSGGYLIIDVTEALTVFDVNSGKYDVKKASEDAFYQINLEAAEEIALQIRLRNLSGIILVDFINMRSAERQAVLLEHMRSLVKNDRVRTVVVDITPLGLMEITRKKISQPLSEQLGKIQYVK